MLCETLSEAAARGIIPIFFVKGGVAIELRLGLLARATRDLDIALCAPPNQLLPLFDSALASRSKKLPVWRFGMPAPAAPNVAALGLRQPADLRF